MSAKNEPGVRRYTTSQGTFWAIDVWLTRPDGTLKRVEKRKIPTREEAVILKAKLRAEAFEGRYFDRIKVVKVTVAELWRDYEPISRRDKKSWRSDVCRAKSLLQHLGARVAMELNQKDIDEYRTIRLGEKTRRGGPPSPATLDLELAQLKRMCSYAEACGRLPKNPVEKVSKLNVPNVRQVSIKEAEFVKLAEAADPLYRPILLVAYDTGMRLGEILNLTWSQVDLTAGTLRLGAADTKTKKPRNITLTSRVVAALRVLKTGKRDEYVFVSQRTGSKWSELRRKFNKARATIGRDDLHFHDLRRSFVTNARRRGVQESVIMRMSGHRTRSVFDRYNVVDDEDVVAAVHLIEAGISSDLASAEKQQEQAKTDD
jgi:integrase